jgi:hypothetical protein
MTGARCSQPDHLLDLCGRHHGSGAVDTEQFGLHFEAWLVGGRGTELAQVHGLSRVDAQAQFLVQLAHQRLTGVSPASILPPGCMKASVPRLRTSSVRPCGSISRAAAMWMMLGMKGRRKVPTREDPMGSLA